MDIRVYEDEAGNRPFEEWYGDLPAAAAAKVQTALTRLENGNHSNLAPVGQGVSERKIDWGPGLRLYLAFDGATIIILLGGGTKKRQQADIETALARWSDYRRRRKRKD